MDVHVHQTGAHHHTVGVQHLGVGLPNVAADDGYPSVLQQNIHDAADPTDGVHQSALVNQQFHILTPS